MKVEIEDVLFWMDAVRNSNDHYRTLESFWKGQIRSKVWLTQELQGFVPVTPQKVVIYGGWNGVLASILFNSKLNIDHITSVDIDPNCQEVAYTVNKRQEILGRFSAVTADMCNYATEADIVINTSCEHITQHQYEKWIENQPSDATYVLQSNDYDSLNEHINCVYDLNEFTSKSMIKPYYRGILDTPKYNRYMLIGKKK